MVFLREATFWTNLKKIKYMVAQRLFEKIKYGGFNGSLKIETLFYLIMTSKQSNEQTNSIHYRGGRCLEPT